MEESEKKVEAMQRWLISLKEGEDVIFVAGAIEVKDGALYLYGVGDSGFNDLLSCVYAAGWWVRVKHLGKGS